MRGIEARGRRETAHRVKQRVGQVFRFAIATGRVERDPSNDLRGALSPVITTSRAAVTDPSDVPDLMRAIDAYQGQPATKAALRVAPLVFARPGNLRAMEWSELDLDAAEWRIPAHKMKVREAHVVPLARQAVTMLRELNSLTGYGRYVFPSLRTGNRPMSENTINASLRRLGYDKETDDRTRIPRAREHATQRDGMVAGRDRKAARTRRAKQGSRRVQPGQLHGRATQ